MYVDQEMHAGESGIFPIIDTRFCSVLLAGALSVGRFFRTGIRIEIAGKKYGEACPCFVEELGRSGRRPVFIAYRSVVGEISGRRMDLTVNCSRNPQLVSVDTSRCHMSNKRSSRPASV